MAFLEEAIQHFLSRPARLLYLPALLFTSYCFLNLIYNIFLHPLRNYPGPFLAKISKNWARIGNLKGRKAHRIQEAHLRYGPIVRVSPNELSFADPAVVREIYTSKAFVKEEGFYRAKRIYHENHLMSFRNVEAHHQRRKLLSKGFSQAALAEFEPSLAEKIQTLMDQWAHRAKEGSTIDVYPWLYWVAFDIIYHLMFGVDPGSVKKGESHEVMKYIAAWRPTYIYKELAPQLEQWGPYLPGKVPGDNFRDVRTWKAYAVNVVRASRANEKKTPFLDNISGDDGYLGRPLNDGELAEECMGGMFGGSGTTANTFVFLLWASLQRRDVVKLLHDELRSTFYDPNTVPDYLTCSKLPYLQAVISETLRRYPTIIATLPRTAVQDTVVGGIPIPKGTVVGTQNYTIHRSPAAFPSPEAFLPSRWLDSQNSPEATAKMREAFVPFSVGPRKCIGMTLAEMELTLLTASFFLRFDAEIDASMLVADAEADGGDMIMQDQFSAAPAGKKLLLKMREGRE